VQVCKWKKKKKTKKNKTLEEVRASFVERKKEMLKHFSTNF
jgi:uncharacterized membrane-anchored protein YhcB (DUF1043 family)